jgi:hypothetical protein
MIDHSDDSDLTPLRLRIALIERSNCHLRPDWNRRRCRLYHYRDQHTGKRSACDPSHPLTSLESLQAKYRMTKRHICKHTEIHNVEQKEKERTTEIIGQLFTAEVKDK